MKNAPQWKPCDAHAAIDILHTSASIITAYTRIQRRTGKELGVVAQVAVEYVPGHFHHYWIAQGSDDEINNLTVSNYHNGHWYRLYGTRKGAGNALAEKATVGSES